MKRITAALLAIAFALTTMQPAYGKEIQGVQNTNNQVYQCNTDPAVIEQICFSRAKTRRDITTSNLSQTKSGFLDQWGYSNYMPSTGNVRALVLTIEFADDKLNDSEEKIQAYNSLENKLFAPFDPSKNLSEQSMRGFLYQSSYGRLDVTGDIMPLYTTSKTCRSCANDGNEWSDCIKEAVDFYINDPTVKLDLSNYDSN